MRYLTIIAAAALVACAPEPAPLEGPQDEPTQVAEQTLRGMAEAQFPGQDAGAIANCGILNATTEELQSLGATGTETDAFLARATAAGVFAKPETQSCMTANGIKV